MYDPLMGALERIEPKTYREWSAERELFDSDHEALLGRLVKNGVLALSQLEAIREQLDKEAEQKEVVRREKV